MRQATLRDLSTIYTEFKKRKDIFPHIRRDYIERQIIAGNVLYDLGVIIVFNIYQKRTRLGEAFTKKNEIILHQILNVRPGNGNSLKAFKKFRIIFQSPIWLTVRESNIPAIKFYKKIGFKEICKINWKHDTIKGIVLYNQN